MNFHVVQQSPLNTADVRCFMFVTCWKVSHLRADLTTPGRTDVEFSPQTKMLNIKLLENSCYDV